LREDFVNEVWENPKREKKPTPLRAMSPDVATKDNRLLTRGGTRVEMVMTSTKRDKQGGKDEEKNRKTRLHERPHPSKIPKSCEK